MISLADDLSAIRSDMQAFLNIYRRLDRIQRLMWFKLAATALVLAGCGFVFGSLLAKSYSLDSQRQALTTALAGQNLNRGDELAVALKNTGQVFINNRTYGGPEFLNPPAPLFDPDGNIAAPTWLVEWMLEDQRPAWAPTWLLEQPRTTWMLAAVFTAWLLLIIWMEIALPFALTALGTAIPVGIASLLDARQAMLAFAGIGLLTFTFVLLTRAALILLHPANQVLAVAHTVVKEASRRGISLVFIIVLLVVLPLLPMALDPGSPLRFRVQSFISLSLGLTFTVAATMTLFFSCASVAFEIRDRQIWHLMTKPLARLNYLLGKWIGVLTVNFIILIVAGASTFTFIQYLRTLPVAAGEAGQLDALAVNDEVLTARIGSPPLYAQLEPEVLRQRVNQKIQNDPELSLLQEVPVMLRKQMERELQEEFQLRQRAIAPGQGALYTFTGLQEARRLSSTLTLKYRFHILRDDEHQTFRALFRFVDDQGRVLWEYPSTYVPTLTHSIPLGTALIAEDGALRVAVINLHNPGQRTEGLVAALNFEEKDFELLYKAGSFEGNFFRALLTMWIKLAVLSALGIACATFLSFPVACLLSFTIFISGVLGPFLAEALEWYYPPETSKMDWANVGLVIRWVFETCTRAIAQFIVFLLSSFGEYRPKQNLIEGRLIEWTAVLEGVVKLGLVWSGLSLLVGYIVLRKRQLAIYSGQG
ncbi:MAG: hypothetical protein L0219_09860 [Phycisphaerales bacterium]|nr:hypothetical protein [Phycisphaerales bacterium]